MTNNKPQKPEIVWVGLYQHKLITIYDSDDKEFYAHTLGFSSFNYLKECTGMTANISVSSLTEFLESKKFGLSDSVIYLDEILTYLQTATNDGKK